jgi:hypothetical protein
MSTVQEILNKVKLFCPKASTWTDQSIIDLFNDEMNEIFRELQSEGIYEFETVQDLPFYTMANDMQIEFIRFVGITTDSTVTADSKYNEYDFADTNELMIGNRYYDALNGLIGIYPVPTESGWNCKIIYGRRPNVLSASNLNDRPNIKEDWHRLLVYSAIIDIAGAGHNPDITMVNNYSAKYNELWKEVLQSRYERKPEYPKTRDAMKKGRFSQRSSRPYIRTPYN